MCTTIDHVILKSKYITAIVEKMVRHKPLQGNKMKYKYL